MNAICRNSLIIGIVFFIMGLTPNGYQKSFAAPVKDSGDKSTPQKTWRPAGPLTYIVYTGPGTAYDYLARQMAQILPDYLGKHVIIQSVVGGGGGNAVDVLYHAKPDGRTFCLYALGTHVALTLEKRYKWDMKDLNVILAVDAPPYAVLSGVKRSIYKDFNDLMKTKGEVRIATGGANFTIVPLILQLEKLGIKYRVARFKDNVGGFLATIAGDADITMSAVSSVTLDPIRAGDLRPLWIYANKRYPDLPDVPTHIELGMPREWASYNIIRLFALPPGVPMDIQNGLTEALIKTLQDKRTIEWSKKAEIPVDIVRRKELEERIRVIQDGFERNIGIVKKYFF